MKVGKLVSVGVLAFGVSMVAVAEDYAPLLSPAGAITGLIRSDSGHVYNRDHTQPGDPGFDDNVYEFTVSSATINPRHVVTAWLFCLDSDKQRIGSIVNDINEVMGSRLSGNIGAPIINDKAHVGFLCGLPSRKEQPDAQVFAEDVAFAEIVLIDHGNPVNRTYIDANGEEVEGIMLQLMSRPEDDPFCAGTLRPERSCESIGSGIVPLHRHPARDPSDPQ